MGVFPLIRAWRTLGSRRKLCKKSTGAIPLESCEILTPCRTTKMTACPSWLGWHSQPNALWQWKIWNPCHSRVINLNSRLPLENRGFGAQNHPSIVSNCHNFSGKFCVSFREYGPIWLYKGKEHWHLQGSVTLYDSWTRPCNHILTFRGTQFFKKWKP